MMPKYAPFAKPSKPFGHVNCVNTIRSTTLAGTVYRLFSVRLVREKDESSGARGNGKWCNLVFHAPKSLCIVFTCFLGHHFLWTSVVPYNLIWLSHLQNYIYYKYYEQPNQTKKVSRLNTSRKKPPGKGPSLYIVPTKKSTDVNMVH